MSNIRLWCPICCTPLYGEEGDVEHPCSDCERAYEAGRLAAVRADVAYAAGHFERRADVWREHGQKAKGGLSRGCMAKALAFAEKAKDCRRWLEMTQ